MDFFKLFFKKKAKCCFELDFLAALKVLLNHILW